MGSDRRGRKKSLIVEKEEGRKDDGKLGRKWRHVTSRRKSTVNANFYLGNFLRNAVWNKTPENKKSGKKSQCVLLSATLIRRREGTKEGLSGDFRSKGGGEEGGDTK